MDDEVVQTKEQITLAEAAEELDVKPPIKIGRDGFLEANDPTADLHQQLRDLRPC